MSQTSRTLSAIALTAAVQLPTSVFLNTSVGILPAISMNNFDTSRYANEEASDLFRYICSLGDNWDGYGGAPSSKQTQINAKIALIAFQSSNVSPDLTLNPNGTISFEWSSSKGDAHLEMGKSRYVGVIRPQSYRKILLSGIIEHQNYFDSEMKEIAELIAASLFPSPTYATTKFDFRAGHVGQAA
jgi:hypothetical protein